MVNTETKDLLDRLYDFTLHVSSTSSGKTKEKYIAGYADEHYIDDLVKCMRYTYTPYKTYNVTEKSLIKNSDKCFVGKYSDMFELLDALDQRHISGHYAIGVVNYFLSELTETQAAAFLLVLGGDLKMRASGSIINKAIPGAIPTFNVALAQKYDTKYVDFETEEWYLSRKLDGIRCICRKENGIVTFYSRKGLTFTTLQKVEDEVMKIPGDFVFDGEICIVDEDGNEDFTAIMKEYKKKDHTIQNPMYIVFDMLTLEEFDTEGVGATRLLSERYEAAEIALSTPGVSANVIKYLEQLEATDENFAKMATIVKENDWEGSMLRANAPYEGKRSKRLLKVKKFFDAEYEIVGTVNDMMRWVEDGVEREYECLAKAVILHKGYEVGVGTGWSKEERIYYHQHPEELIGKIMTTQYFEETTNQKGGISLRFPSKKHVYEGQRDV
jgi:DNA ligase 1